MLRVDERRVKQERNGLHFRTVPVSFFISRKRLPLPSCQFFLQVRVLARARIETATWQSCSFQNTRRPSCSPTQRSEPGTASQSNFAPVLSLPTLGDITGLHCGLSATCGTKEKCKRLVWGASEPSESESESKAELALVGDGGAGILKELVGFVTAAWRAVGLPKRGESHGLLGIPHATSAVARNSSTTCDSDTLSLLAAPLEVHAVRVNWSSMIAIIAARSPSRSLGKSTDVGAGVISLGIWSYAQRGRTVVRSGVQMKVEAKHTCVGSSSADRCRRRALLRSMPNRAKTMQDSAYSYTSSSQVQPSTIQSCFTDTPTLPG